MKKITVYSTITIALSVLCLQLKAQSWLLTGNAGTSAGTHFVGTTDNQALRFRTNNVVRMTITNSNGRVGIGTTSPLWKLDVRSGSISTDSVYRIRGNTVLSINGTSNAFVGSGSGIANTSGYYNTGMGDNTLRYNNASFNTATGSQALFSNTTGNANTATGYVALYSNIGGHYNTANGYFAMHLNTAGSYNTATGMYALYANNDNYNSAHGNYSLYSNTSGSANTAAGYASLYTNSTGFANAAFGYNALYNNTSSYNTALGHNALITNTTGSLNSSTGFSSLYGNTSGVQNTANGAFTLYGNTSGLWNSAFGYSAGSYNDANSYCTFIGADADQTTTTNLSNSTALGYDSRITASNQVRIGKSTVTSIGGYAGWSNLSDGRYKKNIKENVKGLEFINKLRPVTYNLDVTELSKFLNEGVTGEESVEGINEKTLKDNVTKQATSDKEKITYTGFIAQEVESVSKEIGYDFSGVDAPKNANDLYALRYAEFVVPLVKAVQELDNENKLLKKEISQIKAVMTADQQQRLNQIQNDDMARLEQNAPNPFSEKTVIHYFLPVNVQQAEIKIFSSTGNEIRSFILDNGAGHVVLNAHSLTPGVYSYILFVNGKAVDSKQMIMQK